MDKELLSDKLIQKITKAGKPLQLKDILSQMEISKNSDEYGLLKNVLKELKNNNVIKQNAKSKYSIVEHSGIILEGYFNYKRGHSFVITEDPKYTKINIADADTFTALQDDKVKVKLIDEKKGKNFGQVVEIIDRSENLIEGVIEFNNGDYYLVPNKSKYRFDFLINWHDTLSANEGKKAKAKLIDWKKPHKAPVVKIVQVEENVEELKSVFDDIVDKYNLDPEFPEKVVAELDNIKDPETSKKDDRRLDLTDKFIFTIDPADAKDFDDAISYDTDKKGNHIIGVHIADVSYYIEENSETDIEARERGNSTYMIDRVIPMLPEKLSNDICSLRPDVKRNAYSVFITLDKKLNIKKYELHETLIKSKRRYNYEEVYNIVQGKDDENAELLRNLSDLAQRMRQRRFDKGGINFNSSEIRFELDDNKLPIRSYVKRANEATQMIEEFMLLANRAVTLKLKDLSKKNVKKKLLPFLYRVHEDPDPMLVNEALQFISHLTGKKFKKVKEVDPHLLNDVLNEFKDHINAPTINQVLIRSMSKAVYAQKNIGHFGLGFENYTHFTSPIRRYADLIVHRLLKEYHKENGKINSDREEYLKIFTSSVSDHISATEKLSMEAERASSKSAQVILVRNKVGNIYNGTISGVTNFGLFLILDELNAEGLLHIKDLKDDYYRFEENKLRLIGKRTKKIFTMGTRVRVRITKANIKKSQIDFELIEKL